MKNFCLILVLLVSVLAVAEEKTVLPLPNAGDVTLPLDEYNKLLELASKPPQKPDMPPQTFSLQCAELKFAVENQTVLGTVQLEGEVFRKGVNRIPLIKGMTTFDAKQDGK